jgi:nucleoside 2-deoxyribosyltransferase
MMIKVYVAGAYSDDNVLGVLRNIGRGEELASILFQLGFAPFTPWHDKDFVIRQWRGDFTVDMFYKYSIEWLKVSDCVLIVDDYEGMRSYKDSRGTMREIEVANELGIPVFYDIIDLIKFKKSKEKT